MKKPATVVILKQLHVQTAESQDRSNLGLTTSLMKRVVKDNCPDLLLQWTRQLT
jgi:hypothetical protein